MDFVIKYSNIWLLVIFYTAIIHKKEFGQADCKDELKRVLKKFILYFSYFYFIFYEFRSLYIFLDFLT
jgi:hypothetical protein